MSENQLSLYMGRIDPPEVKDDEQYFFVRLKKSEENRSFFVLSKSQTSDLQFTRCHMSH